MTIHQYSFLVLLIFFVAVLDVTVACQSCLVDMTVSSFLGNNVHAKAKVKDDPTSTGATQNIVHSSTLPLGLLGNPRSLFGSSYQPPNTMVFLAVRKLTSVAYSNKVRTDASKVMQMLQNQQSIQRKSRWAGGLFIDANPDSADSIQENGEDDGALSDDSAEAKSLDKGEEVMSGSMIMAIGFYKEWISPLLPPACRFLPTCSQYGAQAIKEYGPQKGLILTAWRLARCSPFGGRGYDPPRWPPVAYNYGSY